MKENSPYLMVHLAGKVKSTIDHQDGGSYEEHMIERR
jgi:hypothetical protein